MTTENNDATQSGVTTPTADEIPPRQTRRAEAMAALEASHSIRMQAETGTTFETVDIDGVAAAQLPAAPIQDIAFDASRVPPDDPDDTDSQLAAQLGGRVLEGEVIQDTANIRVKVKVDGVESQVLLADVLRNYQKGSAADRRLEEATRLLKEAEARAATPAPVSQAAPALPAPVSEELLGKAKQVLSRMYEGDEDGAAKMLVELTQNQGGEQPTLTPALNVDDVAVVIEQRLAVKNAFAMVQKDYPDVLANPDLDLLTANKAKALEATGIPRAEALVTAAAGVYELLGRKPAGSPEPVPTPTVRDEKLKLKAALDPVRVANASAASGASPEDTSPSALIAAMANRRLGQSIPRQP